MIKAGERAPEFTLPDDTGKDRSLTELMSAGAIVLYFYPADFTPGCTRQACVLRDLHTEIESAGLRVVGISPQSPQSHAKFKAKYQLPFVLLSDEQKTVIKMYGVNGPLGLGVRRASYLIDASRRVRDAVLADFMIARHSDFVRKAIMLRHQVRVPNLRHRDDVHDAIVLIADFRDFRIAAQGRNDARYGIAVPDDQHSAAGVLAQRPTHEARRVVGRRNGRTDA